MYALELCCVVNNPSRSPTNNCYRCGIIHNTLPNTLPSYTIRSQVLMLNKISMQKYVTIVRCLAASHSKVPCTFTYRHSVRYLAPSHADMDRDMNTDMDRDMLQGSQWQCTRHNTPDKNRHGKRVSDVGTGRIILYQLKGLRDLYVRASFQIGKYKPLYHYG